MIKPDPPVDGDTPGRAQYRRRLALRQRLHAGENLAGPFCAIPHPVAVELVGGAGFDFLLLDAEHGLIGRQEIEGLVRAGDCVGVPILFRVPGFEGEWIASVLDAGAAGVLVPRIETAEQARAAVTAMRYPPDGKRGVGPGRATGYGRRLPAYLASANQDLLLAIQVETRLGLENIDAIAAVDGIDAVHIGPGDLSASIGAMGPEGKSRLDVAIAAIVEACRRHNRISGIFHRTAQTLADAIANGMRLHTVGADGQFLFEGALAAARQVVEAKAGTSA